MSIGCCGATVLLRTVLLILLVLEFLGQIWPASGERPRMRRAAGGDLGRAAGRRAARAARLAAAAQAYQERRLAEHPCRTAVAYLREQAARPGQLILTQQRRCGTTSIPGCASRYELRVLDGYSPQDEPAQDVVLAQLQTLPAGEFWWIERSDTPPSGSSPLVVRDLFFAQANVHLLEERRSAPAALTRGLRQPPGPALGEAQWTAGRSPAGCRHNARQSGRGALRGAILAKCCARHGELYGVHAGGGRGGQHYRTAG